jgi:hypothetical protein
LDSLFVNIPTINDAIANRKCIKFLYRSYKVSNGRVVYSDNEKRVLPHSCVFNDGKYYLYISSAFPSEAIRAYLQVQFGLKEELDEYNGA